mmetsp:Transcript_13112/g.9501  ORF Transcript_13112/g.9501 Transcript_13112/m.9501 type:complete len:119 (-) Transcript_13112:310-666(-)
MEELAATESNIQNIKDATPGVENIDPLEHKFTVSSRSLQSLEILEDCPIELEEWQQTQQENAWAIRTVKLWFAMHKDHKELDFVKFPQIMSDPDFIRQAVAELIDYKESMQVYITNES